MTPDKRLLNAIRRILAQSPSVSEGHRKVYGRPTSQTRRSLTSARNHHSILDGPVQNGI